MTTPSPDPKQARHVALLEAMRDSHLADAARWPNVGAPANQSAAKAEALDAALRALRQGGEAWRPMDSAPKDGRRVLLRFKDAQALPQRGDGFGGVPFVGSWTGQYTQWGFAAPVGMGGFPDDWLAGWQPLPSAPAQEGEGA